MIATLGAGGAERVLTALANRLCAQGHEVALATLEPPQSEPFYALAEGVALHRLDLLGGHGLRRVLAIPARALRLRSLLRSLRPDVAVSFMDMTNLYALLATRGLRVRVIVSERVDPAGHVIGPLRQLARRLLYPLADAIVVQTGTVRDYFAPSLRARTVVIPNPVPRPERHARPERPGDDGTWRLVAVGRLTAQKGYDRLLAAFAQIASEFPDWRLHIFGEGELRSVLEQQAAALGLEGRVHLAGLSRDIEGELAAAHLFVLPSRYEGFPNALAEALACGLPAIAFNGVSGTSELIEQGRNGMLVDGAAPEAALAAGLRTLMGDAPRRAAYGRHARGVAETFASERIFAQWERLLEAPRA